MERVSDQSRHPHDHSEAGKYPRKDKEPPIASEGGYRQESQGDREGGIGKVELVVPEVEGIILGLEIPSLFLEGFFLPLVPGYSFPVVACLGGEHLPPPRRRPHLECLCLPEAELRQVLLDPL